MELYFLHWPNLRLLPAGCVVATTGATSLGVVIWEPIPAKSSISSISFAYSKSNLDNKMKLPVDFPCEEYNNWFQNLVHGQADNTGGNAEPYP